MISFLGKEISPGYRELPEVEVVGIACGLCPGVGDVALGVEALCDSHGRVWGDGQAGTGRLH